MLDASLAHEIGKNPREIFRRAKHRNIGLMHRIYALLSTATDSEIDGMAASLMDAMNHNSESKTEELNDASVYLCVVRKR